MTLDDAFPLTPEERARLEAAPFRGTDTNGWRGFAGGVQEQILRSYAAGEIDLRRALDVMHACSLGCETTDRIVLVAHTVERALRITPTRFGGRRPPYPTWLKYSAATLVQMLHEHAPDHPTAPNESNGWTTPILETAIAWLVALGLCDASTPIKPRTLYAWCGEHQRAARD